MLFAISARKFRDELLQTEHIEGVAKAADNPKDMLEAI